jgi:YHS domain-containing protein
VCGQGVRRNGSQPMIGILRLILFAVLVYVGVKAFLWVNRTWKTLMAQRKVTRRESDRQVSDMVRDPVCKMYIFSHEGVSIQENGKSIYFCSAECRDKYLNGSR